jgi:hypothetical protein
MVPIQLSRNWFGRINYCLGGRDNKKADFRNFLNSSNLSAKSVQVISPYTSNASESHTVLHTLWFREGKACYTNFKEARYIFLLCYK